MSKRAACYIRVSSEEQGTQYGLPSQEAACRAYCEHNDLDVVGVYSDIQTGRSEKRPGIDAALAAARQGGFQNLVLYDHSRLGRLVEVSSRLRAEFTNRGVQIHYVQGGGALDPESVAGIFLNAVQDAHAEVGSREQGEKARAAKRLSAKAGFVQLGGRIPFGYRRIRTGDLAKGEHKSILEINDTEAELVREVFEKYAAGEGSSTIAQELNRRRIPKSGPGPWSDKQVLALLRRSAYRGVWYFGTSKVRRTHGKKQTRTPLAREEWIEVPVPRIVDDALFRRVEVRLNAVAKRRRPTKREYLLQGRVTCRLCGQNYECITTRSKGKQYQFYRHSRRAKDCQNVRVHFPMRQIDSDAIDLLFQLMRADVSLFAANGEGDIETAAAVAKIQKRLSLLPVKLQRAQDAYVAGEFDIPALHRQQAAISQEEDGLKAQVTELERQHQSDIFTDYTELANMAEAESAISDQDPDYFTPKNWGQLAAAYDLIVEVGEGEYQITSQIVLASEQSPGSADRSSKRLRIRRPLVR